MLAANTGPVSIRSPHKSKGRLNVPVVATLMLVVSIRSPHKSKGRHTVLGGDGPVDEFQSAPLTKARGDTKGLIGAPFAHRFNPLPSQKQGETSALVQTRR